MSEKDFQGQAEVAISSGEYASVTGRNGTFTPRAVVIWQGQGESAWIEAMGKRGVIKGGISLPAEKMDALAMRWLQSRGLVMPAAEKNKKIS